MKHNVQSLDQVVQSECYRPNFAQGYGPLHGCRLKRCLLNQYDIVGNISVRHEPEANTRWTVEVSYWLELAHGQAWSCHRLQRN